MNDIVNAYISFKVNNIVEYIRILASDVRSVSKLPKQLNKVIYKYYDLYILSDGELNYDFMKKKTGLNLENDRLVLFYLLIEMDIASSREYKDNAMFDFYNFLVNSIIIFVEVEKNKKDIKVDYSYEKIIKKIINKYEEYLNYDYILLLDRTFVLLDRYYKMSLKKENAFRNSYDTLKYSINYFKVKKEDNLYLSNFKYKKDNFINLSKKDVELIGNEYSLELNFIHIEILSVRLLFEMLAGNCRKVFVELADDFFSKKQNLKRLSDYLRFRFLKKNIVFLVKSSLISKNEGNIDYLISNGINISFILDTDSLLINRYGNDCYLFVDYTYQYKKIVKEAIVKGYAVVVRVNDRDNVSKLSNCKYVVT